MTTNVSVGLDNRDQGHKCGKQAAEQALAGIEGGEVSLALLFTSHPQPTDVLKGAHVVLGDIPLIGTTTAGQYTHTGYAERGAGVMLIQSDKIRFHPLAHRQSWFDGGHLLGKLEGTSERGLGSPFSHRTLMLFPDDQSMNLDRLVDRAVTETAMLYDIVGGPGLGAHQPASRSPMIFHNNHAFKAGLSATEVLSQEPLGLALANSWQPMGGTYRVTQTAAYQVVKIDGRPALEVYEDFLTEYAINSEENTLSIVALRHPIGICADGKCKVSMIIGFDRSGAMLTASPPPVGSLIHILSTEPDAMLRAAQKAIQQALSGIGNLPKAGALFIDCLTNGMVLADTYSQQRSVVQQCLGDIPFIGIRSAGVLARLQGQTAGHYECSVATCLLPA